MFIHKELDFLTFNIYAFHLNLLYFLMKADVTAETLGFQTLL